MSSKPITFKKRYNFHMGSSWKVICNPDPLGKPIHMFLVFDKNTHKLYVGVEVMHENDICEDGGVSEVMFEQHFHNCRMSDSKKLPEHIEEVVVNGLVNALKQRIGRIQAFLDVEARSHG